MSYGTQERLCEVTMKATSLGLCVVMLISLCVGCATARNAWMRVTYRVNSVAASDSEFFLVWEKRWALLPGNPLVTEAITEERFRGYVAAGLQCYPPPGLVGRVIEVIDPEIVTIEFSPEDAQLIQNYECTMYRVVDHTLIFVAKVRVEGSTGGTLGRTRGILLSARNPDVEVQVGDLVTTGNPPEAADRK